MVAKRILLVVLLAIFCLCLYSPQAMGAAKYPIKFYIVAPAYSPATKAVQALSDSLVKESKGEMEFVMFPGGQLGPESAGLNQLQMGAVQCAGITGVALSVIEPKANVFNLPFIFKDYADIEKFVNSAPANDLAKALEAKGLKLLGIGSYGFFNTIAKKGFLNEPKDFKGVKIRVYPTPILVDLYKMLGASPTPVAYTEVYTALQQGVIEATDCTLDSANASKQYEIAKFLSMTEHIHGWFFFIVNKKWYDGLPKANQAMLAEGFKKYSKTAREWSDTYDEELIAKFKKEKVDVRKPSDKDRAALMKATYPLHEKYRGQIGSDFLDAVYKTVGYQKP